MFKHQLELLESKIDRNWEQAEDSVRKLKFIAKLQNEIQLVEEKLLTEKKDRMALSNCRTRSKFSSTRA